MNTGGSCWKDADTAIIIFIWNYILYCLTGIISRYEDHLWFPCGQLSQKQDGSRIVRCHSVTMESFFFPFPPQEPSPETRNHRRIILRFKQTHYGLNRVLAWFPLKSPRGSKGSKMLRWGALPGSSLQFLRLNRLFSPITNMWQPSQTIYTF